MGPHSQSFVHEKRDNTIINTSSITNWADTFKPQNILDKYDRAIIHDLLLTTASNSSADSSIFEAKTSYKNYDSP
jgi:hypothetical protein